MFLTDDDFRRLLASMPDLVAPLPGDVSEDSAQHPIQPASLDLRMGRIFVPGTPRDSLGGTRNPRAELSLEPGRTAVIETEQKCNMPSDHAAILFPPASLSARGLLMTNPGHVDPGYKGVLSFTVINMGRRAFHLKAGLPIVTALFVKLNGTVANDYEKRTGRGHGYVTEELLDRLSPEFLDIDERAVRAASTVEAKARRFNLGIPVLTAVVALGGGYITTQRANDDEIRKLQQDVKVLQVELKARP